MKTSAKPDLLQVCDSARRWERAFFVVFFWVFLQCLSCLLSWDPSAAASWLLGLRMQVTITALKYTILWQNQCSIIRKEFVEKWELAFLQVVHFHHLFWSSVMTGRIEVINSFRRWQRWSLMWVGRKWQSQDLNPDSLAFAPSPQSIQQLREVLQSAHWYDHYCYFCFSLSSSFLHQFCYHCLLFNIQYKIINFSSCFYIQTDYISIYE